MDIFAKQFRTTTEINQQTRYLIPNPQLFPCQELFGQSGVDVVVEYLRTDLGLLSSGLGHHRLLLAAIDCVWCTVVGCYMTEDYFLEKEGVFLLFDLLEVRHYFL